MTHAIEIKGLGKRYRRKELGGSRYHTLRESLSSVWRKGKQEQEEDYFWALRNINLNIEQGDVVGVIGPNGAGKSTLLKLLSRVTAPTKGSFHLRGRVASLLEVGTGFHPELTGRENIYLSGAIMGMRREEIKRSFDEIVAFSGVEQFLDLPVKRYSSGMYVRLGFAIAAHLQAEIMLVDEVLAVGDAEFQKKCLGKIGDVAKGGRTVLFVSHNLGAVREICKNTVLFNKGRIEQFGNSSELINGYYIEQFLIESIADIDRVGTGDYRLKDVRVFGKDDKQRKCLPSYNSDLFFQLKFETSTHLDFEKIRIDLRIDTISGTRLIWMSSSQKKGLDILNFDSFFHIPSCPLNEGKYMITVCCYYGVEIADWIKNFNVFSIDYINPDIHTKVPVGQSPFIVNYNFYQE